MKISGFLLVIGLSVISGHNLKSELYSNIRNTSYNELWLRIGWSTDCRSDQWQCKNKECISSDNVCDGNEDCKDKSDETYGLCKNMKCNQIYFRCSYGACLDTNTKCNGIRECADNSDELHKDCNRTIIKNDCLPTKFQCVNKQCIDQDLVCDGVVNCDDGSDETITQCSEATCPRQGFRCAYGGCVDGEAPCNGIRDCADYSDETDDICKLYKKPPSGLLEKSCPIPHSDHVRIYNVLGLETKARPGDIIESYHQIQYGCPDGSTIHSLCEEGNWTKPLICSEPCSGMQSTSTLDFDCRHPNGRQMSCNQELPSDSVLTAKCKNSSNKPGLQLKCNNGKWEGELPTCKKNTILIEIEYDDNIVITVKNVFNGISYKSSENITLVNQSKASVILQDKRSNEFSIEPR